MRAGTVMTTWPAVVAPEVTIAGALDLMCARDIRHLPVVAHGALVGMLSDRDLSVLLTADGADAIRCELATRVIDVMPANVVCVQPDTDLKDVIELLVEHKLEALPVVQPDTEAVVGIVSYIDVLRAVYAELEDGAK